MPTANPKRQARPFFVLQRPTTLAEVSIAGRHRRWPETDSSYRRAFDYAFPEGERRIEQRLYLVVSDGARRADEEINTKTMIVFGRELGQLGYTQRRTTDG